MEKISWTDHERNESVSESQGRKESPTNDKNKECQLGLSYLA